MDESPEQLQTPERPVRLALIGCGNRARAVYEPLMESLAPWIEPVAVCDPVPEARARSAGRLGVPAFDDLRRLIEKRPMEAALVITPRPTHYALVMALLDAGVHCHVETPFAWTVAQSQRMVEAAGDAGPTLTVTENFPRMPIDRFAQTVRDDGCLGLIGRVFSYNANANYHNNARWLAFAGQPPVWVQAIRHDMEHPSYGGGEGPAVEDYHSRFFRFPDGLLITDHRSNSKCRLGRTPRPGYEEYQGTVGTLRHRPKPGCRFEGRASLHRCSQEQFGDEGRALADQHIPVEVLKENGCWAGWRAETPEGPIEYLNPLRTDARVGWADADYWYGVAVMDHVVDFALSVRGLRDPEFSAEEAAVAVMMDKAAQLSMRKEGRRVEMPLDADNPVDAETMEADLRRFGADPLDYPAVLAAMFNE